MDDPIDGHQTVYPHVPICSFLKVGPGMTILLAGRGSATILLKDLARTRSFWRVRPCGGAALMLRFGEKHWISIPQAGQPSVCCEAIPVRLCSRGRVLVVLPAEAATALQIVDHLR